MCCAARLAFKTRAQFIYDGKPIAKKVPLIKWGKLMVFLSIRSIYPNGTNYKLMLNDGKNLWGKFTGKINGKK